MKIISWLIDILILIILQGIIYFRWFYGSDNVYADAHYSSSKYLSQGTDIYTWNSITSFGSFNEVLFRFPRDFIHYLISGYGYDSVFIDRITIYFGLIFFSSLACMLIFGALRKGKERILFYTLSICFIFNSYTLASDSQGHTLLPIAGYLGSISFFFLWKYLGVNKRVEKSKYQYFVISILFLILSSLYDFRYAYIFIITNSIFLVFTGFRNALSYFFIFVVSQLYWVLPFIVNGSYSESNVLGRELFGGQFWTMPYSIAAFHPFWDYFAKIEWFSSVIIPFSSFLLPAFFMGYLIIMKRDRISYFLIGVILVCIFLGKLDNAPFGEIYQFLYAKFPGFNAFRESSKFFFVTYFFYLLILFLIFQKYSRFFLSTLRGALLLFTVSIVPILSALSIFLGYSGNLYANIERPNEYDQFIEHQYQGGDILWYPMLSDWGIAPDMHNVQYTALFSTASLDGLKMHLEKYKNIAYIVIMKNPKEDSLLRYQGISQSSAESVLSGSPFLQELHNSMFYRIFQVKDFKGNSPINTKYKKINPTKYNVQVSSLETTYRLDFLDTYNPGWKISLEPYNPLDCITEGYNEDTFGKECGKEYQFLDKADIARIGVRSISGESHKSLTPFGNSWILNENEIRSEYPKEYYKENPDGSIDIRLTLYFRPQSYFYIGLIFSSITVFFCLSYLLYARIYSNKEKG